MAIATPNQYKNESHGLKVAKVVKRAFMQIQQPIKKWLGMSLGLFVCSFFFNF